MRELVQVRGRCHRTIAGLIALVALSAGGCGEDRQPQPRAAAPTCGPAPVRPTPVTASPWALTTSDLPVDFTGPMWVAAGTDGRIYAEGDRRLVLLDVKTGAWTAVADLPGRRFPSALAVGGDGTVYVVGGPGGNGGGGSTPGVDAFHPATGTWTAPSRMRIGRYLAAVTAGTDGRIYAVGGIDPTGHPLASAEAYDPASDSWKDLAPMPAAGSEQVAVTEVDGRIYVIGGTPSAGGGTPMWVYDPAVDAWAAAPALPAVREQAGAVRVSGGRIVVPGGRDEHAQTVSTVDVYDPATRRWGPGPPMVIPRVAPGAAVGPDGRVYAVGGDVTPVGGPGCPLVRTVEAASL